MSTDDDTIARNIVRLRKAKGLSQSALADAMRERGQDHWRQNTVSRVETGKQSLNFGELRDLTDVLGNVLEETKLGGAMSSLGKHIAEKERKRYLDKRLRSLDERLTAALDEVRQLRWMFDDDYQASPEDDARWGEMEV